jgi:ATP-dependent DNA helicase RecG
MKFIVDEIENVTEKDLQKDTEKMLSKNQIKILNRIAENRLITAEELVEIVGINLRNIKSNIAKLKSLGILERVGADKGGYWKILKRQ